MQAVSAIKMVVNVMILFIIPLLKLDKDSVSCFPSNPKTLYFRSLECDCDELYPVGNHGGCHQNGGAEIDDFHSIRGADQQHTDQ